MQKVSERTYVTHALTNLTIYSNKCFGEWVLLTVRTEAACIFTYILFKDCRYKCNA